MKAAWKEASPAAIAIAVGTSIYLLSSLVQPPATEPNAFGVVYSQMSAQPFDLVGMFPQRILGPMLAWFLGLGGERFHLFAHGCGALLVAVVFWFCRRTGAQFVDALLIATAIALTGAVQMYKSTLVGYSDNLGFLLFALTIAFLRNYWACWALMFVNLFNHEMVLFFAPWLVWLRRRHAGARLAVDMLAFAAVAALYFGYRMWVAAHAVEQALTLEYYWANTPFPIGTAWLCVLSAVHWLLEFGPMLMVVAWAGKAFGVGARSLAPWLFLAALAGMFVLAYDVHRFANYFFVPLVLASLQFLGTARSRWIFLGLLGATVGSYLCLTRGVFLHITTVQLECGAYADHFKLFTCVIPRIWATLVALGAALAVLVVAGRRLPVAPAAPPRPLV